MSLFRCEVVRIDKLERHPNADTLSIVRVKGWQVVVKTSDFKEGDLAAYIPIDAQLPEKPEFEFLRPHKFRVKTIKLRGQVSQGLLIPAYQEWKEGQDVTSELGAIKYEPPIPVSLQGTALPHLEKFIQYRDIEQLQNFPGLFDPSDIVWASEKVHGTNARFGWIDGEFCVGGHRYRFPPTGDTIYAKVAANFNIHEKIKQFPDLVFFGEIYGRKIQKFSYNAKEQEVIFYDIYNSNENRYLNFDEFQSIVKATRIPSVPILFEGEFAKIPPNIEAGDSIVGKGSHIREGIVIRTKQETWSSECQTWKVAKLKSAEFLIRE